MISKIKIHDALGSRLSGVRLRHLCPPAYYDYLSLAPLGLRISQANVFVLWQVLSGVFETKVFWHNYCPVVTFCLVNCFCTFCYNTDGRNRYCSWYLLCCLLMVGTVRN
jgi:uncharacterized membrane protein